MCSFQDCEQVKVNEPHCHGQLHRFQLMCRTDMKLVPTSDTKYLKYLLMHGYLECLTLLLSISFLWQGLSLTLALLYSARLAGWEKPWHPLSVSSVMGYRLGLPPSTPLPMVLPRVLGTGTQQAALYFYYLPSSIFTSNINRNNG